MFAYSFAILAACQVALAATITYDWTAEWVTAAPDGFERPVIGINGEWPCPTIDANVGDTVVVNLQNNLGNQSTSIHWHGMHQRGTGYMDGATGATQCPLAPGDSMTYEFVTDQAGTYWYHSHNLGQYPDGLWGPLIVRGGEPFEYDGEFIVTLTDWYHDQMSTLLQQYQSTMNENTNDGDEPTPDAALINAATDTTFKVEPGKTYLFRFICVGNFPGHGFDFDQHSMTVVEVDGIWTDQFDTTDQQVRMTTGQRMSALVTMKNSTDKNYAFFDTMDINMLFVNEGKSPPSGYNPNVTAWLVYNDSAPLPPAPVYIAFNFTDDVKYTPYDREPVLEPVDHQIILDMNISNISGISRYILNNETYLTPEVPSLYSAITLPLNDTTNPSVYGHASPFILKYNEVVEIVVNDYHENLHPFHLHGHQFQTVVRTDPNGGYFNGSYGNYSATPMRRDTLMVQNGGHAVIRFRADNPGTWLFHCHIEWHTESGLTVTMIEAPEMMQNFTIPQGHIDVCKKYGSPTSGNSLGNTQDPTGNQTYFVPSTNKGAAYPPTQAESDT